MLDHLLTACYRCAVSVQLNIAEAKAKLSELVARAERGEEVVLARAGKPVAWITTRPPDPAPHKPWMKSLGAWSHLGPLSDAENELLLAPDPDWVDDPDESSRA